MSGTPQARGAARRLVAFLLRILLPRALGGLVLGAAVGLAPLLLAHSPGFLVRWILPAVGAAAGLAAGLALFLATAVERIVAGTTGAVAARVTGSRMRVAAGGPARYLDRRIRGAVSGPVRALRLAAILALGLAAALSALTILLLP